MKRILYTVFLSVLLFTFSSCVEKDKPKLEIPTYSFTEPIVNPPDEFMIVFNISWVGTREATITFDENAVWEIEKLGDGRADVNMRNDQGFISLLMLDTLGIKAGITYHIEIKTNYVGESNNYFLRFKKTDIDFDGFTPIF